MSSKTKKSFEETVEISINEKTKSKARKFAKTLSEMSVERGIWFQNEMLDNPINTGVNIDELTKKEKNLLIEIKRDKNLYLEVAKILNNEEEIKKIKDLISLNDKETTEELKVSIEVPLKDNEIIGLKVEETKQETKEETKQETKEETKEETKQETKEETKQETKEETKQETKEETKLSKWFKSVKNFKTTINLGKKFSIEIG